MKLPFSTNTIVYNGEVTDADAAAFIAAAGITNQTQQTAINILVLNLKAASLWTKMNAIYPFVGGTADTHKYNLKDPRDLDAAYRIVFAGGWTHNSNGITGNGINTDADTKLNASTVLNSQNQSVSIYIRTDNSIQAVDVYNKNGGIGPTIQVRLLGTTYFALATNTYSLAATSTSLGFYLASRTSLTQQLLYRNGSPLITGNVAHAGSNPNGTLAYGNWVAGGYVSNRNYAFATIGQGLDATENANLYTAVQAYQTALGRQV